MGNEASEPSRTCAPRRGESIDPLDYERCRASATRAEIADKRVSEATRTFLVCVSNKWMWGAYRVHRR
jgi:hypothetical protein